MGGSLRRRAREGRGRQGGLLAGERLKGHQSYPCGQGVQNGGTEEGGTESIRAQVSCGGESDSPRVPEGA